MVVFEAKITAQKKTVMVMDKFTSEPVLNKLDKYPVLRKIAFQLSHKQIFLFFLYI